MKNALGTGTPASRLEGLLRNPAYTIGVGYIYNVQTDTKKSAVYFLTPCTEPPV
jgi:hypothetical protein